MEPLLPFLSQDHPWFRPHVKQKTTLRQGQSIWDTGILPTAETYRLQMTTGYNLDFFINIYL